MSVTVAELFRFPSFRSRSLQHSNMKASLVQSRKGKQVCLITEIQPIPMYSLTFTSNEIKKRRPSIQAYTNTAWPVVCKCYELNTQGSHYWYPIRKFELVMIFWKPRITHGMNEWFVFLWWGKSASVWRRSSDVHYLFILCYVFWVVMFAVQKSKRQ